eukprot:11162758-Lingulodinium_polyedra.AAC.1
MPLADSSPTVAWGHCPRCACRCPETCLGAIQVQSVRAKLVVRRKLRCARQPLRAMVRAFAGFHIRSAET